MNQKKSREGVIQSAEVTIINTVIFFLMLHFSNLKCQANTYFVSPKGSDTNQGTSINHSKPLINASYVAMPGDTILVREGIYRERVAPVRGGKAGAPIVYMAEPNKTVIIRGSELWSPNWQSKEKGFMLQCLMINYLMISSQII